jgi:hypothetical protein
MAFSRALGVIGIVTVSWLAAVGCDDDDGKKVEPGQAGGEGGEAPAGGKSSAGGSTSNGGGGKSSGGGGTSSAGDGGAGLGGAPPIVDGGAGGEPVTPSGGAAGDGGAGGEPAAALALCGNECEMDADCNLGPDSPGACDQETKRCYDPSKVLCQDNADCVPPASFWTANCTSDSDCVFEDNQRCVELEGVGWCAPISGEGCTFGGPTALPLFEIPTATVTVCAATWDRCRDGSCEFNCADPVFGGFCEAGNGNSCNEDTGLCECEVGAECNATGICGADKHCTECATDQDCIDKNAAGLDKCFAGRCGCGSAASCPDNTQAATPVCE